MGNPFLLLITNIPTKVKMIGFPHRRCQVSALRLECEFTADVAKIVGMVNTLPTLRQTLRHGGVLSLEFCSDCGL